MRNGPVYCLQSVHHVSLCDLLCPFLDEDPTSQSRSIQIRVTVDQMGLALIGSRPDPRLGLLNDVMYLAITSLTLDLSQSKDGEQTVVLTVDRFQIDNGNRTTPYPVVFRIVENEQSEGKPLLQFSAIKCSKEMGPNSYRMIQVCSGRARRCTSRARGLGSDLPNCRLAIHSAAAAGG
jgi:hypothetical protein